MIDLAIFDLDGTILDSMKYWRSAHKDYLRINFNIIENEDLSQTTMKQSDYESACYIKDRYNLSLSYEEVDKGINELMRSNYKTKVKIKDGMLDLIDKCYKMGLKMALASSTEKSLIIDALKHFKLDKYFKTIVSSYDVGVGKRKPDIYIKCANDLGCDVKNSIVFEDLPYGLISSKSIGAFTVGVYDDASINLQDELKGVSDIYIKNMDNDAIDKILNAIKKG